MEILESGTGQPHDKDVCGTISGECCAEPSAGLVGAPPENVPVASCACKSPGPGLGAASGGCCAGQGPPEPDVVSGLRILPMAATAQGDEPCCGPPQGPPASPYERAGYRICRYVEEFVDTKAGPVPRVAARLGIRDYLGMLRVRIGFQRDRYRMAPGLYCVGKAGADSPVLVTANYKLSFDSLRRELDGIAAWILVLDTRGINVWCAAGKKNFSSEELIRRVKLVGLDQVVSHRRLILPQLGAPGVAAHKVRKGCGFSVVWGPIRAHDLREFLSNGHKVASGMRQVSFTLAERAVLIPVELSLIIKPTLWVLLALFVLSGIGPGLFSIQAAWGRGLAGVAAYGAGVLAGAIAVPLLLPWLPGRQFFLKGLLTGLLAAAVVIPSLGVPKSLDALPMALLCTAVSSYAAMNFTGATPFTSPTGVEKEMRQAIPLQVGALATALVVWLISPFVSS